MEHPWPTFGMTVSVPYGWLAGIVSLAARADAEQTRHPLLLFLSAAWCEPCKILQNEVLSHPELRVLLSKFTLLVADVEKVERIQACGGHAGSGSIR